MRILIVADQYYPPTLGGSAIAARRLAHGLAGRDHEVLVLAPSTDFSHRVEREGRTTVVRCRSIPALHLRQYTNRDQIRVAFLPHALVARTFRTFRPEVVHIQIPAYIGAAAAHLARKSAIPIVATQHAMPENLLPTQQKDSLVFRAFGAKFWENVVHFGGRCDVVTAPSQTACRLLREHGLTSEPIAVSNGVDLAQFRPAATEAERAAARAALGVPPDPPIVLYAGRLAFEKRLDVLIAAAARVLDAAPAHFVLTGAGATEITALVEAAGIREHVSFTGVIADELFPLVYRAADVFVLPSEAELQGIVLLEAAASGLPLVGADAYAIPELIDDGENGYLHRPGDTADLAEKLLRLLRDPDRRRRMGERSRELVQAHSLAAVITRYETVYWLATRRCRDLAGRGRYQPSA
ncbi:MAG: glycosyltransferase [Chloroflexi bacterium]|nr:glycosyltransferase [Chloroflexota bacterium]